MSAKAALGLAHQDFAYVWGQVMCHLQTSSATRDRACSMDTISLFDHVDFKNNCGLLVTLTMFVRAVRSAA